MNSEIIEGVREPKIIREKIQGHVLALGRDLELSYPTLRKLNTFKVRRVNLENNVSVFWFGEGSQAEIVTECSLKAERGKAKLNVNPTMCVIKAPEGWFTPIARKEGKITWEKSKSRGSFENVVDYLHLGLALKEVDQVYRLLEAQNLKSICTEVTKGSPSVGMDIRFLIARKSEGEGTIWATLLYGVHGSLLEVTRRGEPGKVVRKLNSEGLL